MKNYAQRRVNQIVRHRSHCNGRDGLHCYGLDPIVRRSQLVYTIIYKRSKDILRLRFLWYSSLAFFGNDQ